MKKPNSSEPAGYMVTIIPFQSKRVAPGVLTYLLRVSLCTRSRSIGTGRSGVSSRSCPPQSRVVWNLMPVRSMAP